MTPKPRIVGAAVALSMLAGWGLGSPLRADEPKNADQKAATAPQANPEASKWPYLGVSVENLHPSLASHLANRLGAGRGVLVSDVTPGSPADKAGLKPDDIIVRYDDQHIYAPQQFAQLVRHARPGSDVTLSIVRAGQPQQIMATLGEHRVAASTRGAVQMPLGERVLRPRLRARDDAASWGMFDSLTLTRTDATHFKAEIKFRDNDGKIDARTFQGTRDEIRRDIDAQKDLPQAERDHLLRTLNLPRGEFELDLPGFPGGPDGATFDSQQ